MARADSPAVRAALVFTLAFFAAAGLGLRVLGDREFVVYFGVVAVLAGVVAWLHRRVGFSPAVIWGLSVLGALHMAGGLLRTPEGWPVQGRRVLYNLWLIPDVVKFDQVVHFYGSVVGTWACWQWLRVAAGLTRPTPALAVICALAGTGLGAINEAIEFLTTRVVTDTNVGGFENTGWDLVANLAGATTAAGLIARTGRRAGPADGEGTERASAGSVAPPRSSPGRR